MFAAYDRWGGPRREIEVYPYDGHEGGDAVQPAAQLRFAAGLLAG